MAMTSRGGTGPPCGCIRSCLYHRGGSQVRRPGFCCSLFVLLTAVSPSH